MKAKKVIAAVLALTMVFGAAGTIVPNSTFFSTDITVSAEQVPAGGSFDESTGVLTLSGNITTDLIEPFMTQAGVKSIVAADNCVMPEDCSSFFDGNERGTEEDTHGKKHWQDLKTIDLSKANFSNVTNMSYMFAYIRNLDSVNLSGINVSNVKTMFGMFDECEGLKSVDLSGVDASNTENFAHMFSWCCSMTSLNLSGFKTSKATNMSSMFMGCYKLTSLDLSGFNTSKVTDMSYMFEGIGATSLDLSGFDTSNVTDMTAMFNGIDITSLDLSNFNTSKVTSMEAMFRWCSKLSSLNISSFDTSKVQNMSNMFELCTSLTVLDLSSFDTSSLKSNSSSMNNGTQNMFSDCKSLETIYVSDKWNLKEDVVSDNMFGTDNDHNTPPTLLVGGNGTKWSKDHINGDYARIDKEGQKGYFTDIKDKFKSSLGDVNADGKIDIEDAVMVINHVNGQKALTDDEAGRANVDGNSSIDIEDAVAIISHVNGVKSL